MPAPDADVPVAYRIVPLGDVAHVAPTLAAWHHAQWGWMNPGRDVADRVREFREHLRPGQVPTTFVAMVGDAPAGSASLIAHDMDARPNLTPWMASVFVHPDYRRNGIASALVDTIVAEAAAIGVDPLYLFTPDQMKLYGSLGWAELETVTYRGELETVMSISPAARVKAKQA